MLLRRSFRSQPRAEACGPFEPTPSLKPDLVVLDLTMPELNGLAAARRILAALPGARILILTVHESEELAREILAAVLGISVKTAATHRSNIMRKGGFGSLAELVRYAIRNRMIDP